MSSARYQHISQQFPLLRGMAIVWVVSLHLFGSTKGYRPLAEVLRSLPDRGLLNKLEAPLEIVSLTGDIGVHLFLIISGFGLASSWWHRYGIQGRPMLLRGFWQRRLLRILPLYWVAVALACGCYLINPKWASFGQDVWASGIPVILGGLGATLTTVRNLIPDYFFFLNGAWWYVGLAVQLYIVFPVLLWVGNRWGWSRLLLMAGGISLSYRAVLAVLPIADIWYTIGIRFCLSRLFEFALGMVLAITLLEPYKENGSEPVSRSLTALCHQLTAIRWLPVYGLLGGLGIVLAELGNDLHRLWSVPADALISIGAFAIFFQIAVMISTYRAQPLATIGHYSYGIYLTHMNVYLILWPLLTTRIPSYWPRFIVVLLLTCCAGGLIEELFRRLQTVMAKR